MLQIRNRMIQKYKYAYNYSLLVLISGKSDSIFQKLTGAGHWSEEVQLPKELDVTSIKCQISKNKLLLSGKYKKEDTHFNISKLDYSMI